MTHTMQEALLDAGLTPHSRQAKAKVQALVTHPDQPAKSLPKWLTRNGRSTGPVKDFFRPLRDGKRVWLIHPSNRHYVEVISITQWNDLLAKVQLAGEDQPRKFRLDAKVKYVVTGKHPH